MSIGGFGSGPFGGGPFGYTSWTMQLLYGDLPPDWKEADKNLGYPWRRFIQAVEPLYEDLKKRADHPEILIDTDSMRLEFLKYLALSLGLTVDQYYPGDWRRTSVRMAHAWWAVKGTARSIEILARLYGFDVVISEIWEKDGQKTFTPPPATPLFDTFPADWVILDAELPQGSREITGEFLTGNAGVPLPNGVLFTNALDIISTASGFDDFIDSSGEELEGVWVYNPTDDQWVQVKEVLSDTQARLMANYSGTSGAVTARVYPSSLKLTGVVRTYGPGYLRSALTGTVTFTHDSARVIGNGTRFIDEVGGFIEREEDVYIWLDHQVGRDDRRWAKVLSVVSQAELILGAKYQGDSGTDTGSYTTTPNGDRLVSGVGTQFTQDPTLPTVGLGDLLLQTWLKYENDGIWSRVDSVENDTEAHLRETYPGEGGLGPARVARFGYVRMYDLQEGCGYCKTDIVKVALEGDASEPLTGTIEMVAGSDIIDGVGTVFTSEIELGEVYIKDDGGPRWYRIKTVLTDTQLQLSEEAETSAGPGATARYSPRTVNTTNIDSAKALGRVIEKLYRYVKPIHVRFLVDFVVTINVPPWGLTPVLIVDEAAQVQAAYGEHFDILEGDAEPTDQPWYAELQMAVILRNVPVTSAAASQIIKIYGVGFVAGMNVRFFQTGTLTQDAVKVAGAVLTDAGGEYIQVTVQKTVDLTIGQQYDIQVDDGAVRVSRKLYDGVLNGFLFT